MPPGILPRGSGRKHFVVTPDDRLREAVYGVDYLSWVTSLCFHRPHCADQQ